MDMLRGWQQTWVTAGGAQDRAGCHDFPINGPFSWVPDKVCCPALEVYSSVIQINPHICAKKLWFPVLAAKWSLPGTMRVQSILRREQSENLQFNKWLSTGYAVFSGVRRWLEIRCSLCRLGHLAGELLIKADSSKRAKEQAIASKAQNKAVNGNWREFWRVAQKRQTLTHIYSQLKTRSL